MHPLGNRARPQCGFASAEKANMLTVDEQES